MRKSRKSYNRGSAISNRITLILWEELQKVENSGTHKLRKKNMLHSRINFNILRILHVNYAVCT